MIGLTYTNEKWSALMSIIESDMQYIGQTRGQFRDFSWNLIAWASFTAIDKSDGFVQFYAAGDVGVIFQKKISTMGYSSAYSDVAACTQVSSAAFFSSSRSLAVSTELATLQNGVSNCFGTVAGGVSCTNPCPNILSPQGMGYDPTVAVSSTYTWTVDMAAVTTAIAVNMGILPLENLVNYPGDNNRISLLRNMVQNGSISQETKNQTSSYYESLYAPSSPIYW
jgi:hypothetical protein